MTNMAIKIGIGASTAVLVAVGAITLFGLPGSVMGAPTARQTASAPETAAGSDAKPLVIAQAQSGDQDAAPAGALPGGASSLQEGFQDWQVVCVLQTAKDKTGAAATPVKRCVMNQQQVRRQNQQRVLAIELMPSGDKLGGALILPFGLALEQGATLQVDDGEVGAPLAFRTCLPSGCVVSLSFDADKVAALQKGTTLKIKVVADGGSETRLAISLKGFAAVHSRLTTLSR